MAIKDASQIHAILKAVYRDHIPPEKIASLLCVKFCDITDVLLQEKTNQAEVKVLNAKPLHEWATKKYRQKYSSWSLETMRIGEARSFYAQNMDEVSKFRKKLKGRVYTARKKGLDFYRQVRGREIIIERIA